MQIQFITPFIRLILNKKILFFCFSLVFLMAMAEENKVIISKDSILTKKERLKFLSHRVRGFDKYDATLMALKKAIKANIKYIEIDVRASKDGILYVYHDPCTGNDTNKTRCFYNTYSDHIKNISYNDGQKILTLEDALIEFKNTKRQDQYLCIDIKDYGYEKKYIQMVRHFELETNVVFISWIPQTLLKLNQFKVKAPLIFSHFNFMNSRYIPSSFFTKVLKNLRINLFNFIIMGQNTYNEPIEPEKGYQHCMLLNEIPKELQLVLSNSKGGICIPKIMIGKKIFNYCNKKSLKLWIFSANTIQEFKTFASNSNIDVIFCNFYFNPSSKNNFPR